MTCGRPYGPPCGSEPQIEMAARRRSREDLGAERDKCLDCCPQRQQEIHAEGPRSDDGRPPGEIPNRLHLPPPSDLVPPVRCDDDTASLPLSHMPRAPGFTARDSADVVMASAGANQSGSSGISSSGFRSELSIPAPPPVTA